MTPAIASTGGEGNNTELPEETRSSVRTILFSSKVWVGGEYNADDFGCSSQVRKTQEESAVASRTVVPDKNRNQI